MKLFESIIRNLTESEEDEEIVFPQELIDILKEKAVDIAKECIHNDKLYFISYDDMDFAEQLILPLGTLEELFEKYLPELMNEDGDFIDDDYRDAVFDIYNEILSNAISDYLEADGYVDSWGSGKPKGYTKQDVIIDSYDEILQWLDDNNVIYETSRSTQAGLVPSIYIKARTYYDENGDEIDFDDINEYDIDDLAYDDEDVYRIANHYNHDFDSQRWGIYTFKDYADWQNKILPDIENVIDYYPECIYIE